MGKLRRGYEIARTQVRLSVELVRHLLALSVGLVWLIVFALMLLT